MSFWIAVIPILLYIVYWGWKGWIDPATQLGRQAANMHWATSRYLTQNGIRHHCVKRGSMEAMIDQEKKIVRLLHPEIPNTFKDFVELERWLGEAKATATEKSSYMRKIAADGDVLSKFIADLSSWPTDQASAATHIVTSIIEKSNENLDPYMDKLTVWQMEIVSEVVSKITGVEPSAGT